MPSLFEHLPPRSFQGIFMIALIYIFATLYFTFFYFTYRLPILGVDYVICKNLWSCFIGVISYALHGHGWPEDIGVYPDPSWGRFTLDMSFFIIIAVILAGKSLCFIYFSIAKMEGSKV